MSTRYHTLDHWRGLACLMVLIHHSTYYAVTPEMHSGWSAMTGASLADRCIWLTMHWWIGVPMFFAISGYCIAASAQRTQSPVQFFAKRLRRIYPPLWAFFAFSIPLICLAEVVAPGVLTEAPHDIRHPASLSAWQWIGNLTLTEEWLYHVVGGERRWIMGHCWTLSYEEQFYVLAGLLLAMSPKRLFAGFAAITILVTSICLLTDERDVVGFFFDGKWISFAAGVAVFYTSNVDSRWQVKGLCICAMIGFAAATDVAIGVACLFSVLLMLLQPADQALSRRLQWAWPIQWCGLACYSLYLVHWPVCKLVSHGLYYAGLRSAEATLLATVPACLAASLLLAWPFHVFVERRFMSTAKAV